MATLSLATPRPRRLISWRMRKLLIGYSSLVPAALCMLATVVVPIILAIKMSLYADVLYKPQDYRFIGVGNYVRLVQDPVFWLTLWNSVVWVFGSVILQFVFGFAAALLLQQAFRGRTLVRTLTLLPWIIPGVRSEFGGLGVRLGDTAIRVRICRRTVAAAGLQGAHVGAHAHAAALDHPGSQIGIRWSGCSAR